jgi:nitronate monooxygenase
MVLDDLRVPIVLAPLAGGPSTPALTAAVCDAGAFGFLASGYLTPAQLEEQLEELQSRTRRPFGVNVFTPAAHPSEPAAYAAYAEEIRRWAGERGLPVGEPAFDDDGFSEKLDLLCRDPAAVVSFTFGMPGHDAVDRLHAAGSEVWVTATTPSEAALAIAGGADALVVQGSEAGGHRGSFDDGDADPARSLLSLLQLLGGSAVPLVATGGLMSGPAIAAALAAGARAAQLGTAFLLCPEAGTPEPQRAALREAGAPTRVTRAFTGRAARGIVNPFMQEHDARAVSAYPEIHHLTAPLRRDARARGDASMINLWAGEAYPLIRELPAGELVRALAVEAGVAVSAGP